MSVTLPLLPHVNVGLIGLHDLLPVYVFCCVGVGSGSDSGGGGGGWNLQYILYRCNMVIIVNTQTGMHST